MTPPRNRNTDIARKRAEEREELRLRVHRVRERQLLDIDAFELALNYARTRYFEFENAITNARIRRLEVPPSFADILLWVGLGGVAGPVTQALTRQLLRRLLANNLVFVQTYTNARMKPAAAVRVREFFKIDPALKVTAWHVPQEQFLNPHSVWGRVYRYVPEYIGSRFDEIVQGGPQREEVYWPDVKSVAESLLHLEAWAKVQRSTIREQYNEYDAFLNLDDLDSVRVVLEATDEPERTRPPEDLVRNVVLRAQPVGEYFLLALVAQRYGPSRNLAEVRRSKEASKLLEGGKGEYRYVSSYKSGSRPVIEILVRGLIHPRVRSPVTFFDWAVDRLPASYKKMLNRREVMARAIDDAAVEMLGYFDLTIREIASNPSPYRTLFELRPK